MDELIDYIESLETNDPSQIEIKEKILSKAKEIDSNLEWAIIWNGYFTAQTKEDAVSYCEDINESQDDNNYTVVKIPKNPNRLDRKRKPNTTINY